MRLNKTLCLASLAVAFVTPARAQQPAGAEVVLPPRLAAGQLATLAVLDAAGRLAPKTAVELWDGSIVVTDATGRARFTAPAAAPRVMRAWLAGGKAEASAVVLAGEPAAPRRAGSSAAQIAPVPQLISRNDRFSVFGAGFAVDPDGNRVLLGGKRALVLAASPDALVILPSPGTPLGATRLEVNGAAAAVTMVAIELPAEAQPATASRLEQGQRVKLRVLVEGTERPVELEARNFTPEIVRLRRGNSQRIRTSGGADNAATLELEGLRPGAYRLEARLAEEGSSPPDVEAARQALVAAQRLAPPPGAKQIGQLIEELRRQPKQYARVRARLELMLAGNDAAASGGEALRRAGGAGDFRGALEAAYEILKGR